MMIEQVCNMYAGIMQGILMTFMNYIMKVCMHCNRLIFDGTFSLCLVVGRQSSTLQLTDKQKKGLFFYACVIYIYTHMIQPKLTCISVQYNWPCYNFRS